MLSRVKEPQNTKTKWVPGKIVSKIIGKNHQRRSQEKSIREDHQRKT